MRSSTPEPGAGQSASRSCAVDGELYMHASCNSTNSNWSGNLSTGFSAGSADASAYKSWRLYFSAPANGPRVVSIAEVNFLDFHRHLQLRQHRYLIPQL